MANHLSFSNTIPNRDNTACEQFHQLVAVVNKLLKALWDSPVLLLGRTFSMHSYRVRYAQLGE